MADLALESDSLLTTNGLTVSYRVGDKIISAATDININIRRGEMLAIVGESGSGKSTIARSLMGLLPSSANVERGEIWFGGADLTLQDEDAMARLRGRQISWVPQDPLSSLNPLLQIGVQVMEGLVIHGLVQSRSEGIKRAHELLEEAGLPDAENVASMYPNQLSGGMRQRALIAIALACGPKLIIADEPTSALDVTTQRKILDRLRRYSEVAGTSILLITHDLGVAAEWAQRVVVMKDGAIVEAGETDQVLRSPATTYARQLLRSAPSMNQRQLYGTNVNDGRNSDEEPILKGRDLHRDFRIGTTQKGDGKKAVDGVSFDLFRGETLGVVGESGSGKTTLGRMAAHLETIDSGSVTFNSMSFGSMDRRELRRFRRGCQMIYQNPFSSLDPRLSVSKIIMEPLIIHTNLKSTSRIDKVRELLEQVGLPTSFEDRYPSELSGGQRQRVAIARALALEPQVVICDEPTSALDVTVQAQVLELFAKLQSERNLAYIFISHDLAVIRQMAHKTIVMRDGCVVERGPTEELLTAPAHSYTQTLIDAIPRHATTEH